MADQLAEIKEKIRGIEKDIHSIERLVTIMYDNLNEDRKDLAKVSVGMATVAESHKQLLNENDQQTKKIVNEVVQQVANDVPEKAREGVQKAFERIKPKVVQLKMPKRSWNPLAVLWSRG